MIFSRTGCEQISWQKLLLSVVMAILMAGCATTEKEKLGMERAEYFRQISMLLHSRIQPPPGLSRWRPDRPDFIFHYAGNGQFLSARILETSGDSALDDWFVDRLNKSKNIITPIPVTPGGAQEFDVPVLYGRRR